MTAALSVPEHCLSFYFVCDDQIQISCAVWLRKMENLAMTFCYLWLTEKLWLTPLPRPIKTLITVLPVTFSQLDPQLGVGWGKKGLYFDRLSFNRWLKLFICQIFSRLAFGIKGCSSKTRFISGIFRLLCIALWHTWAYYIHCIFRLCASVCLRISVMQQKKKKKKKKKICFK